MKRHIAYTAVDLSPLFPNTPTQWAVVITEQTHRGEEFTPDGKCFEAALKHQLWSDRRPEVNDNNTTNVRGAETVHDNDILLMTSEQYHNLRDAVAQYNHIYAIELPVPPPTTLTVEREG